MAEKTLIATVTVKAGTPVGMRQVCNLNDGKTSAQFYNVPKGYVLVVKDVFIKASGDVAVDGIAIFMKNDKEEVTKTAPLSTLLVSNPSRPRVSMLVYDEFDKLTVDFTNLASPTADSTDTFYIIVDEIEKKAPAGAGLAGGLAKLKAMFK